MNTAACYSIVANATRIILINVPWVQTHGYNHSAANAAKNLAGNDGERQDLTDKSEKYETDINNAVYSLYDLTVGEIQLDEGN